MSAMSPRARGVVIVCVAIFALAAIAAVPMFALLDAHTPIDALFWSPAATSAPLVEDAGLPAAPIVDRRSPRAPPLS